MQTYIFEFDRSGELALLVVMADTEQDAIQKIATDFARSSSRKYWDFKLAISQKEYTVAVLGCEGVYSHEF